MIIELRKYNSAEELTYRTREYRVARTGIQSDHGKEGVCN